MDDITVSRDYFLTLLRRAELADQNYNEASVRIGNEEYEVLRNAAEEYKFLVNALVAAGTPYESIRILIASSGVPAQPDVVHCAKSEISKPKPSRTSKHRRAPSTESIQTSSSLYYESCESLCLRESSPPTPSPPTQELMSGDATSHVELSQESSLFADNYDDRSIVLKGIPKSTRLNDVAKVVRGGAILNLFMRPDHGMAHVAFVDPESAENFLIYAKRNELSIKGCKVTASWDEKQYYLPGRLAKRIHNEQATRNLVVRFPNEGVTEKVLRDDLEHINRLEVVEVYLRNGHAWISLNNIRYALTARSCMQSRLRYRGSRIEFWPDESAGPFPSRKTPQPQPTPPAPWANWVACNNRFLPLYDETIVSDNDSETKP